MALSIDFDAAAIGRQALSLRLTPESFRHELPCARTFALAEDIEQLRAAGLARGGSLDNAVVADQARVLNPAGLRMPDEFARHKLLDAVGDLALAGAPLRPVYRTSFWPHVEQPAAACPVQRSPRHGGIYAGTVISRSRLTVLDNPQTPLFWSPGAAAWEAPAAQLCLSSS